MEQQLANSIHFEDMHDNMINGNNKMLNLEYKEFSSICINF